eukprot:CAMPEP_0119472300 /NCGR_PEP_ID=MMETSP1344-20130328/4418_1 /TAXON_ID=236787 /ORGANISM="Florenciella parvula, Strain CCMP2471" /LENGTH=108 /DNA_ID=CAMNT_0007505223 /DNA_START=160 /DNA_END=486 /DNA_ORIENTATION=+
MADANQVEIEVDLGQGFTQKTVDDNTIKAKAQAFFRQHVDKLFTDNAEYARKYFENEDEDDGWKALVVQLLVLLVVGELIEQLIFHGAPRVAGLEEVDIVEALFEASG